MHRRFFLSAFAHIFCVRSERMSARGSRRDERMGRLLESVSRSLDIPQDTFGGCAHVEIRGNREAIVDGCCGVLEYCDDAIALNTGRMTVRFRGCDLTILSMQNGQAVIKGMISSLEYGN